MFRGLALAVALTVFAVAAQAETAESQTEQITRSVVSQLKRCWADVYDLPKPWRYKVVVQIDLDRDGGLQGPPHVVGAEPENDPHLAVAVKRALDAAASCEPYQDLPVEAYDSWKRLRLNFQRERPEPLV